MIDLCKEIIFRDGITLDNGEADLTEEFVENVHRIRELGESFGLSLDEFEINDELVYFEWRGSKRDVLRFYTRYSKSMTTESPEVRKATQRIILNK